MTTVNLLLIIIPTLAAIAFLTLVERKLLGYIQLRKGPNVVGPFGLLQPFADAVKLFTKEPLKPSTSTTTQAITFSILHMIYEGICKVRHPVSLSLSRVS